MSISAARSEAHTLTRGLFQTALRGQLEVFNLAYPAVSGFHMRQIWATKLVLSDGDQTIWPPARIAQALNSQIATTRYRQALGRSPDRTRLLRGAVAVDVMSLLSDHRALANTNPPVSR